MKDQIDVAVRRSPKYSVFMGIGAVLGVIVAGILAMFVDPTDMPMGYTVAKGLGLLLLVLGIGGLFLGGLVALILDWTGKKRAKEYRVDAQIDMVDDPKEVARRRIAEARGEDPDAGATADAATDVATDEPTASASAATDEPAASASASTDDPTASAGASTDDPTASAGESVDVDDAVDNGDSRRGSTPDSTV
ncbi:hypothetical protein [Brevibacterium spongiae]|uniref:Lipopolysaccharide assembly protein A domain-containing protein n=1 Tax=Brevibacterium spongiae TaxID=2909672 RepID=A0ABY5SUJ0_9MICO|nr:hypothetical protein [Brevibacterium spongiae]UVI36798.1 hypothetical protein L1F31_03815 [Brevibacterium spongiae]